MLLSMTSTVRKTWEERREEALSAAGGVRPRRDERLGRLHRRACRRRRFLSAAPVRNQEGALPRRCRARLRRTRSASTSWLTKGRTGSEALEAVAATRRRLSDDDRVTRHTRSRTTSPSTQVPATTSSRSPWTARSSIPGPTWRTTTGTTLRPGPTGSAFDLQVALPRVGGPRLRRHPAREGLPLRQRHAQQRARHVAYASRHQAGRAGRNPGTGAAADGRRHREEAQRGHQAPHARASTALPGSTTATSRPRTSIRSSTRSRPPSTRSRTSSPRRGSPRTSQAWCEVAGHRRQAAGDDRMRGRLVQSPQHDQRRPAEVQRRAREGRRRVQQGRRPLRRGDRALQERLEGDQAVTSKPTYDTHDKLGRPLVGGPATLRTRPASAGLAVRGARR